MEKSTNRLAVASAKLRAEHPEKVKAYNEKYNAAHRDDIREQQAARRARTRESLRAAGKRYRDKYPDRNMDQQLRYLFGLSLPQYKDMLEAQGGVCAICGTDRPRDTEDGKRYRWDIDHDHECCPGKRSCGKCIRGLLCTNCNSRVLGGAKDNPVILYAAISYLERWRDRR